MRPRPIVLVLQWSIMSNETRDESSDDDGVIRGTYEVRNNL